MECVEFVIQRIRIKRMKSFVLNCLILFGGFTCIRWRFWVAKGLSVSADRQNRTCIRYEQQIVDTHSRILCRLKWMDEFGFMVESRTDQNEIFQRDRRLYLKHWGCDDSKGMRYLHSGWIKYFQMSFVVSTKGRKKFLSAIVTLWESKEWNRLKRDWW